MACSRLVNFIIISRHNIFTFVCINHLGVLLDGHHHLGGHPDRLLVVDVHVGRVLTRPWRPAPALHSADFWKWGIKFCCSQLWTHFVWNIGWKLCSSLSLTPDTNLDQGKIFVTLTRAYTDCQIFLRAFYRLAPSFRTRSSCEYWTVDVRWEVGHLIINFHYNSYFSLFEREKRVSEVRTELRKLCSAFRKDNFSRVSFKMKF